MEPYALSHLILRALEARGPGKSICPSEIARTAYPAHWRAHMQEVRTAARALAQTGLLRITQGATTLDPQVSWHGPIRLRLPSDS